MFENKFPDELYHSYVIEGNPETLASELISYLEKKNFIKPNSGNVLCQIYDAFTIAESPLVKDWHSQMGSEGEKKICILGAKFINHEAEHSLLKILEEPKAGTHFFLIIPNADVLLPTILSRVQVITPPYLPLSGEVVKNPLPDKGGGRERVLGKKFLNTTPKERLEIIAEIIKEHKNDEDSSPVRYEAIALLNSLEKILHERLAKGTKNKDLIFSLEEIGKARMYLNTPGAGVKMLLEHIALVI